jgi:hypothetical protein
VVLDCLLLLAFACSPCGLLKDLSQVYLLQFCVICWPSWAGLGCCSMQLGLLLYAALFVVSRSATQGVLLGGPLTAGWVLLLAAWFAGLCPWFDMVCKGADAVLVCRPMFAGWVATCYWVNAKDPFVCWGFVPSAYTWFFGCCSMQLCMMVVVLPLRGLLEWAPSLCSSGGFLGMCN